MGGGDLNMKKSWHPLLLKNQERVWLEEKKALEEKKKLDQLRKEKEEERQLQELQRLQEMQTGKKRTEKLEWMYNTPATGSSANPNDLEDYLLGKKRVDKILTADENAKLGASHKNFIAVQNANTLRDTAAKIREDPLFAIKQQEQAAYEKLMSNPLLLRKMQERNGIKPKKEKKERKREKEEKRRKKEEHRGRPSRSPSPLEYNKRSSSDDEPRRYQRSRSPRRSHSERARSPSRSHSPTTSYRPGNSGNDYDRSIRRRSRSPSYDGPGKRRRSRERSRERSEYTAYKRSRHSSPGPYRRASPPLPRHNGDSYAREDRAARLAAMSSDATVMSAERRERLAEMLEKEKTELVAEEDRRAKNKGYSKYISDEQKRIFGSAGGLEDRIRRGRGGMVIDAD